VQATESQAQSTHAMLAAERCANVRARCLVLPFVGPPPPPVLDLTCSVYHIPPRRACSGGLSTCGNAACAAAISSIDDAALSLMKTGFTVSPRPRRVKAVVCWRSQRVCMRARSGVRQGVQTGVCGALTQLPVQACGALPDNDGRKNITVYATYFSYPVIYARATECGLPASTVTLTPPAPNSCDGAYTRLMGFEM
jgi:hypothetical protein